MSRLTLSQFDSEIYTACSKKKLLVRRQVFTKLVEAAILVWPHASREPDKFADLIKSYYVTNYRMPIWVTMLIVGVVARLIAYAIIKWWENRQYDQSAILEIRAELLK